MAKKTIYIFVNGINTRPADSRNWTGQAVTHIHVNTPHKAEKVEYYAGIFTKILFERSIIKKLYRTLQFYRGWNIILVGHSNGTDVITDTLNRFDDWPNIKEIHLVCGASEADFEKANFNKYLSENRIGRINVYVAGRDIAINFFAKSIFGKLLGFKTLGRFGPYKIEESLEYRVNTFWGDPWKTYHHSECFSDENFESTMKYFI